MPDFKLRDGKIYFSILNDNNGQHPLLIPIISNSDFIKNNTTPGIVELAKGDLGITEKIIMPILEPVLNSLNSNPLFVESVIKSEQLELSLNINENTETAKKIFIQKFIPKNTGLKPLEKTIITSILESYKPLADFLKLFIEMLAIAEDISCKFLGTSIKVLKKQIGIPSRNPLHWSEELNYAKTINYSLEEFQTAADKMTKEIENNMLGNHPLKNNLPNSDNSNNKPSGTVDLPAIYIGYFDEDGNNIDPPNWVKNSGKWFSRSAKDLNNNNITVGSPFDQLSTDINNGFDELRERHQNNIDKLIRQKNKMLNDIDSRAKQIEKEKTISKERKQIELNGLNDEKREASKLFQNLIDSTTDILDGTNKAKNNFVDDDPNKGVNDPTVINEWQTKVRGSQLRQKYYPDMIPTVQSIIDKKGKPKEPYINIPKIGVLYKGRRINVEVPLAFENQIEKKKVKSSNTFFDNVKKKDGKKYSFKNEITNLDIFYNTDTIQPFKENPKTHFSNEDENVYVADNVKNYYLPIEWEEILEYEIRKKSTGQIIRTEREVIPFSIDIENDYELRLIQVINEPLIPSPGEAATIDYFPENINDILIVYQNSIKILKSKQSLINQNVELIDFSIQTKIIEVEVEEETDDTTVDKNPISNIALKKRSLNNNINQQTETQTLVTGRSNEFRINRYTDTNLFKSGDYFLLKKTKNNVKSPIPNTTTLDNDPDDSEIFQIKQINENWVTKSFDLNVSEKLKIDNENKIIYSKSKNFSDLPDYILESRNKQFKFISNTNSNNIEIKITKITNNNSNILLTYDGDISTQTISDDDKKITIKYQYLESISVETVQQFNGINSTFTADFLFIDDINYIPNDLKQTPVPVFIQGLDQTSILSTIQTNTTRQNISSLLNEQPTVDGLFNIVGTSDIETNKKIKFKALNLQEFIPKKFINKAFLANPKSRFYLPVRIVGVPTKKTTGDNIEIKKQLNNIGTIYTFNNNIPLKYDPNNQNIPHSTPDINEENNLKEGIIFHGLDPRFVERNKFKYFWLIEAIKKENDGTVKINNKPNINDLNISDNINNTTNQQRQNKGKEWYGLLDRFNAMPQIITKLLPVIVTKLIPLAVKILQLVSNPSRIKEMLLDIAILDENISKFPQNFTAFSKSKTLGNIDKIKTSPDFTQFESNPGLKDPFVYSGPQINKTDPKPISILDGQALIEFGKGAFGKSIINFGIDLKGNKFEKIDEKTTTINFNKPAERPDQNIFNFILSLLKLPFETLFMIFKWIVDWIKKLLNPAKIPAAITEFLSFSWIKDILGKESIFKILGLFDIQPNAELQLGIDSLRNGTGETAQNLLNKTKEALKGQNTQYLEVLVYNILLNGNVIDTQTIERPYSGPIPNTSLNNNFNDTNDPLINDINTPNNDNTLSFCGPRFFDIKSLFPIPLLSDVPKFNNCEIPIIFLKPLELLTGILKFLQDILNGFLSIPTSILGLDPQIKLPQFGKEIPFANILEDILNNLKSELIKINPL